MLTEKYKALGRRETDEVGGDFHFIFHIKGW